MLTALLAVLLASQAAAPVELWRLDCGKFEVADLGGKGPGALTSSCYLIRHGDTYLLWDAGLGRELIGKPDVSPQQTISLDISITDQLARIGVKPEQVTLVAVSHYHGDHTGQAADFPHATLLIGAGDYAALTAQPRREELEPDRLKPWLAGKAPVIQVARDHDIFGDGSAVMLPMPGHTPGHSALLVRLASGPVLLTGDLYHFASQYPVDEVSRNATDPAEAKRSMLRFKAIARDTGAKVIIQHETADVAKLPLFPASAR